MTAIAGIISLVEEEFANEVQFCDGCDSSTCDDADDCQVEDGE